jgi:hypothetical protein
MIKIECGLLLSLVFMGGCSSMVYAPKPPVPRSTFSVPYLSDLSSPMLISVYNAMPEGSTKVARRNQIIFELVWLTDRSYDRYEAGFYSGQAYLNTATDLLELSLDAAASVTGTAATKSILSIIAGGVVGSKTSYEKNFYDQQTREVIVAKMEASRAEQLAVIETGMAISSYTLEQGLLDAEAYYRAGTVIGALEAINNSTSQQANAAHQAMKGINKPQ